MEKDFEDSDYEQDSKKQKQSKIKAKKCSEWKTVKEYYKQNQLTRSKYD